MSPAEDPKIVELISGLAKDVMTNGEGEDSSSKAFQSLEFFPPRTDAVRLTHAC